MGWGGASVKLLAQPGDLPDRTRSGTMPTITRFLGFLLVLAAAATAAVLALAYLVTPEPRTYTVPIDPSVLSGARPLSPPPAPAVADPAQTDATPANLPGKAP